MGKEQAIDLLDNLIGMTEDNQDNDYDTAFRMAIEALKAQLSQEGTTKDTTSDLISRQAAIDALDCINGTEEVLRSLPPAQPEPCGDKSYALWKESYEELKRRMDELTSCSDTISRQATIDAVNNAFDRETLLTGFVRSIAVRAIRDMPSAQPEPHEGHWIDKGWDGDWAWQIDGRGNCWRLIECSECGKRVFAESNYCPNCGAKMKGEPNE